MKLATMTMAAAIALASARSVRAETPAAEAPANYVIAIAGTTLSYKPPGESMLGPQRDLATSLGYGRFVTDSIAAELDVGLVVNGDGYIASSLTPGAVWAFHPWFYAAGRAIVIVHPEANLVLFPGLGAIKVFDSGLAATLELNLSSTVGRGDPDLGTAASIGLLYGF